MNDLYLEISEGDLLELIYRSVLTKLIILFLIERPPAKYVHLMATGIQFMSI